MDAEGGVLAPGEEGELEALRGPNVTSGYWRDAEGTAQVLREGWLRTGDLAVLADDALFVTGRLKDVVIVDGRNVHAADVEGNWWRRSAGSAAAERS